MDDDVIERMARLIEPLWFTDDGSPPIINNYPDQHLRYQERARQRVREALAGIREPTKAMLAAAEAHMTREDDCLPANTLSIRYWQAMIDAILAPASS